MRVLVVTVVHTPLDARIHRRQIGALLDAGHDVVFAAPFTGHGVAPDEADRRITTCVDLPRASQWDRVRSLRAARLLLRDQVGVADVALVHDPELLLALPGLSRQLPVVWDVHEDLGASFADKPWVPRPVGRVLSALVRRVEAWAEGRCRILLAEHGYAERFRGFHPVVPNVPPLPERPRGPQDPRVVYLGRVSPLRGAVELVEVGRALAQEGIDLQVLGPVDADVSELVSQADRDGWLDARGFVPNDVAMAALDGALAGLSLLHDHPNYRHSMPTKLLEYQAAGVPWISTPLPAARDLHEASGSGILVPFGDPAAVVSSVQRLHADPGMAAALGRAGRADAEAGNSWDAVASAFVAAVEAAAAGDRG